MARAYSVDLRQRVLAACDAGGASREVAQRYQVSRAWVDRLKQRRRETGEIGPRRPRSRPSVLAGQMEQLRALVTAQPDLTLAELRHALGVRCSLTAVWRALRRLHLTRKKVLVAQEQTRPEVVAARQHWRQRQPTWAGSRLVFLDESGFTTKLTRQWGRAPRGQRCVGHVPHGSWQTTTFVGALRATGLTAPLVLDGPLTTEAFRASGAHLLGPTLRPGDLVILDNLSVHKDPVSAQLIAQRGATLLFLPPYSPDLNPIEQAFAKLKALARGAALRSREALWTYLGVALTHISPLECRHYFRHCGYTVT